MQELHHPTHARTTLKAMMILLGIMTAIFVSAFYFNNHDGSSIQSISFAVAFILCGAIFMAIAILRAYICKCATCGNWLTEQVKVDTDEFSRKFVCQQCKIMWDSKVKLTT